MQRYSGKENETLTRCIRWDIFKLWSFAASRTLLYLAHSLRYQGEHGKTQFIPQSMEFRTCSIMGPNCSKCKASNKDTEAV
jgi:hypothetical protein